MMTMVFQPTLLGGGSASIVRVSRRRRYGRSMGGRYSDCSYVIAFAAAAADRLRCGRCARNGRYNRYHSNNVGFLRSDDLTCGGRCGSSIGKHWRDKRWDNVVSERDCRLAFRLDWVVAREFEESTSGLLIDSICNVTLLALVHAENALIDAACGVTKRITSTLVNRVLQDACVPSINEVCMISVTGWVAIRIHKWLSRIHGL